MKRSRLLGAAIGAASGAAIALGVLFYLYGRNGPDWQTRLLTAAAVAAVGALLGSLSGVTD
jgi:hypothetical protein